MHHQIDSLAYTNKLRSLPPKQKLGFAIALFLLGYLAPPLIQILIALWLTFWVIVYAGIPVQVYGKLIAIPVSFWIMSLPALVMGLSWGATVGTGTSDVLWGFSLGQMYLYLSAQGLEQARTIFLRAIALTSCLYFILFTVPFVEIIRVLRDFRCPALITELLVLMYRFIFVLTDTVMEILTAQQSRLGYGNWRTGMHSLSLLIGQLLSRTLENYRQISLGLMSRGFNGELRVLHTRRHRTNWRYAGEAIAGYVVLLILTGVHYVDGV
ncbi:cobalt ABC transporter, inner membrane subunit CbiQ [Halothece sp. PCC 7418]|uniref:cobalt ECF transporter T component CbiQ n=1 Tax=Halothece sp. (strain PCC 7418) TaxID=65093 RepID=UPI0002A06FB2|nr:cobalt ECF transporter T component CbiQ [Halothece sp. PCC 7418]AFZ45355.1 cobalt ABC transporter, inner membrane subunit CbiQ [Halothece sp. PCC 7418]